MLLRKTTKLTAKVIKAQGWSLSLQRAQTSQVKIVPERRADLVEMNDNKLAEAAILATL